MVEGARVCFSVLAEPVVVAVAVAVAVAAAGRRSVLRLLQDCTQLMKINVISIKKVGLRKKKKKKIRRAAGDRERQKQPRLRAAKAQSL